MLLDTFKRFQLLLFFILCLTISLIVWIPQALITPIHPKTPLTLSSPPTLVVVWAPAALAILLSRVIEGKSGMQALFQSLRRWRVDTQWYLFVLLYPAAIWFLARAIDAMFGRALEFTVPILTHFPPD
jgi:hypothetical protein